MSGILARHGSCRRPLIMTCYLYDNCTNQNNWMLSLHNTSLRTLNGVFALVCFEYLSCVIENIGSSIYTYSCLRLFGSGLLGFASEGCVWKHTSIQICDRKVEIYLVARDVSLSLSTRYKSSMGRAILFAVVVLWVIDVAYMLRLP